MNYRFLTEADLLRMHDTFLEAFADYFVQMSMSLAQFAQHLANNGVRYDCSVGAFAEEKMIGILLNGVDDWQGELTAYDAGTGVIPAYRGQGIAGAMLDFARPMLRDKGITQCLLEVIRANGAAIKVYRRLGFVETRTLECIRLDSDISLPGKKPAELKVEAVVEPDWAVLQSFWDWQPAWQNSIGAIRRSPQHFVTLVACVDQRCLGYVTVNSASGGLAQLAVERSARGQGIGTALLRACRKVAGPEKSLSMINIDGSAAATLAFFERRGFESTIGQYEMLLRL